MVTWRSGAGFGAGFGASLVLCVLAATGSPAVGAVASVEDLSGCKLTNGVAVLALEGTSQGAKGTQFKFSTRAFVASPVLEGGVALTPEQVVARMRTTKAADLQFLPDQNGSFWAFSGSISELGTSYLADQAGKKLDAPGDLPKTSVSRAGLFWDIAEGRVYLVQTTDNRYALVRVLEKTKTAATIQYVYQSDGTLAFDIPRNALNTYGRPADAGETPDVGRPAAAGNVEAGPAMAGEAATGPARPVRLPPVQARQEPGPDDYVAPGYIVLGRGTPNAVTGLDATMEAFTQQRTQMIQRRIAIVQAPASSASDMEVKARAMGDLSLLHADEACEALVGQIAFFNPHNASREFSQDAFHPAVAALKHIGKPASAAALAALRRLDISAGQGMESDMYKAGLLGDVIRAVEGDDVAGFLFRREVERESDPKRREVFDYLAGRLTPQQ